MPGTYPPHVMDHLQRLSIPLEVPETDLQALRQELISHGASEEQIRISIIDFHRHHDRGVNSAVREAYRKAPY